MRKNLLVFCCVTLLTALLFGCNGIPAFASDDIANTFSAETKKEGILAEKVSVQRMVNRKNDKKKVKKSKKNQKKTKKAAKIENYIKNGKFNYESYGKAIGADDSLCFNRNLDYIVGECFIEISTNLQEDDKYYIAIGFLDKERTIEKPTYFIVFEEWEESVKLKKDIAVPLSGLKNMQKVIKYMIKHPDPYSVPEIEGFGEWRDDAAEEIR